MISEVGNVIDEDYVSLIPQHELISHSVINLIQSGRPNFGEYRRQPMYPLAASLA